MKLKLFDGRVIDFNLRQGDTVTHPDLDREYKIDILMFRKVDVSIHLIGYGYFNGDIAKLKKVIK